MPTGVFNADGSEGGLAHGLGTAPEEAVYVSGPKAVDEGVAEGATIVPGAALVAGTSDGQVAAAAEDSALVLKGIAHENDLKADDLSVLAAYGDGENVPYYFRDGLVFAATADGAIPEDGEVAVGASPGTYKNHATVGTGTKVGKLLGKAAAADTDRILIYFYGGRA